MTQTQQDEAQQAGPLFCATRAVRVERISPTFVRIELAGEELADFGIDGPVYDQRIKLVFPTADGGVLDEALMATALTDFAGWYARPADERGHMRTYSIREVLGERADTRLVVDFAVHEDGLAGPGAGWALAAAPGDVVWAMVPRRGVAYGGIEFAPPRLDNLLLVGDESAVPAVARILADLAVRPDAAAIAGRVYLEVPASGDVQELTAPPGVSIGWLARGHAQVGDRLVPEVRAHFGLDAGTWEMAEDVDPDLWETPTWSSSGADVEAEAGQGTVAGEAEGLYAWIAGESRMVTTLRRALVKELEVDRSAVAFMGYWRKGVAMKG